MEQNPQLTPEHKRPMITQTIRYGATDGKSWSIVHHVKGPWNSYGKDIATGPAFGGFHNDQRHGFKTIEEAQEEADKLGDGWRAAPFTPSAVYAYRAALEPNTLFLMNPKKLNGAPPGWIETIEEGEYLPFVSSTHPQGDTWHFESWIKVETQREKPEA